VHRDAAFIAARCCHNTQEPTKAQQLAFGRGEVAVLPRLAFCILQAPSEDQLAVFEAQVDLGRAAHSPSAIAAWTKVCVRVRPRTAAVSKQLMTTHTCTRLPLTHCRGWLHACPDTRARDRLRSCTAPSWAASPSRHQTTALTQKASRARTHACSSWQRSAG
jgi:hypothetical protein